MGGQTAVVAEVDLSAPREPATAVPTAGVFGRAVAVAVDAMELLRPASDLARLLARFDEVDVLLAAEDVPGSADDGAGDGADEAEEDEVSSRVHALELPGLVLHRLGLLTPHGPGAVHDLVAALSELVGFDPEPGVYCLAPDFSGGLAGADPAWVAVHAAAQRIARVYGIPLLRYRCLELSVVG